MTILEFTAKVENGQIEVPQEYQKELKEVNTVTVIVTSKSSTAAVGSIAQLMKNPIKVKDFVPLTRDAAHERR